MNQHPVIGRLRKELKGLGLKRDNRRQWHRKTPGGAITVNLVETDNVSLRATWTDGEYLDTMFFDFGMSEDGDEESRQCLTVWIRFYSQGNRMTEDGTIGYVSQPREQQIQTPQGAHK